MRKIKNRESEKAADRAVCGPVPEQFKGAVDSLPNRSRQKEPPIEKQADPRGSAPNAIAEGGRHARDP